MEQDVTAVLFPQWQVYMRPSQRPDTGRCSLIYTFPSAASQSFSGITAEERSGREKRRAVDQEGLLAQKCF